jgi:hypothetical protein
MAKQKKLPDGEFYVLAHDGEARFSPRGQFDPDPQETELIKTRRRAYYRSCEANWEPSPMPLEDLFHRRYPVPPPIAPDLVHRRTALKRPMPRTEPDHILHYALRDYATENDAYTIVSPEWRDAIEIVEPGVHEFFPHAVEFSDGAWTRCILRSRQKILFLADGPNLFAKDVMEPFRVRGRRPNLEGRHWVQSGALPWDFSSRALAERLLPMLPSTMMLVPITLVD